MMYLKRLIQLSVITATIIATVVGLIYLANTIVYAEERVSYEIAGEAVSVDDPRLSQLGPDLFRIEQRTKLGMGISGGSLVDDVFEGECTMQDYIEAKLSSQCHSIFAEVVPFQRELSHDETVCGIASNERLVVGRHWLLPNDVYQIDMTKVEGLEHLGNALLCDPQSIGVVHTWDRQVTRDRGLFEVDTIINFMPAESFELFRIMDGSPDEGAHLVVYRSPSHSLEQPVYPDQPFVLDYGFDEAAYEAEINLMLESRAAADRRNRVPVSDQRWSDAAIALGRTGASGCGEFSLSTSGVAHCLDSGERWQIDFGSQLAAPLF